MSTRLGRPTAAIELSETERETLERWARRPGTALAWVSRIVLLDPVSAADGRPAKGYSHQRHGP